MKTNYIKKILKNGVKLYLYIDPNMRKTHVDYAIDYGSSGKYFNFYYEGKEYHVMPGVAHFLEHMLGEHSKYGNMYTYFTEKKYLNNGMTSSNITRYYFCGVDDIKKSIEVLINSIDDPVFTKEDVEKTKEAIIEETKRGLNNKYQICTSLCVRNLYQDVDLYHESLNSIGDEETTSALDYDTLKLCYDAFYYDENKYLLIAGNFDEQEMTDYIESIYAKLKPHKKKVEEYTYRNLDKVKTREDIRYMSTSDDLVAIGFKQVNKGYSRREIATYLGFLNVTKLSEESNFIERLKKEDIISYLGTSWHFFFDDNNYNMIIGANIKDYDRYKKELINELKTNNFTEKDFELFLKNRISKGATKIDFKYDVFHDFHFDREYTESFDEIDFLKTLTYDKFLEFYKTLKFDNYTVAIVKDESKK